MTAAGVGKAKGGPEPSLDDAQSARTLIRVGRGGPAPADTDRRLSPEWLEGLTLAEQDGQDGLRDWVDAVRQRDPGRADAIRKALDDAERTDTEGIDLAGDPVNAVIPGPFDVANRPKPVSERKRPPRLPPGTSVKALDRGNIGTVVEDFGDEGVDVHFVSPAGFEATVRMDRANLRRPDGSPLDPLDEGASVGEPFDLKVVGTSEFMRADYRREWLVKGALVKGRPGVIGGPQKCMKTSITVDLLVALAGGGRFFGLFKVPAPTKVLLISGESGAAVVQETCRRVCRSKGIDPEVMEGFAYWGFDLPRLDCPEQLGSLAAFLRENGVEVVILDPLYLCLLTIGHSINPANLFDVGPLLKKITQTCLDAGATPLLVHRMRKNRENPFGPPELEDLSFAGVQEFARQWLLVNRRERYEPGSGEHRLWFSVGGSDGHSGEWAVDVGEGVVGEDFGDREWRVSIDRASQAREEVKQRAEQAKAEKLAEKDRKKTESEDRKRLEAVEYALETLRKAQGGLTRTK